MAYKTLLLVVRSVDQAEAMIGDAAGLARRYDAHLDVLCLGIDQVQVGYYFAGADAIVQQTSIELASHSADDTLSKAKSLLEREDVRWSARGIVAQFGALSEVIANNARYADLVLVAKPYGDNAMAEDEAILESALFSGQSPVLVLPESGIPNDFGTKIVVGWNEGSEALNAIRAALPALALADLTSVSIVDPPKHSPNQTEPGQALTAMLSRHGVSAEITLLPKTMPRVSDVLLSHANSIGATLLVTGAYGHSRFRQAILGGATREILEKANIPVLMAH